jgi:hypothetical protein
METQKTKQNRLVQRLAGSKPVKQKLFEMYNFQEWFVNEDYFNDDYRLLETLGLVKYNLTQSIEHRFGDWDIEDREVYGYSYSFTKYGNEILKKQTGGKNEE